MSRWWRHIDPVLIVIGPCVYRFSSLNAFHHFALLSRLESIHVCGWLIPRVFSWQQEQQQQRVRIVKTWRTRGVNYSILEDIRGGSVEITTGFAQTQKEGDRKMKKQQQCLTTEEEWDDLLDEESWKLDLEGLDTDEVEALLSDLDLDNIDDELMMSSPHSEKKTLPAADMEEWLQEEAATPVPLEPRRKRLQELLEEDSSWGQEEEEESAAASLSDDEGGILKPPTTMLMPPGSLEARQRAAAAARTTRNQLLKLCILHFGCSILLRRMSSTKADYRFHVKCTSGVQCLGCVLCDRMISRSIKNNTTTRFHRLEGGEEGDGGDRGSLLKSKVIRVSEVSLLGGALKKAPRNQVNSCTLQPLLLLLLSLAISV